MRKLALVTLAAAGALSSAALAQTVSPADRYEGTPEVPLKGTAAAKPAKTTQSSSAPAPIAQPLPAPRPNPPAGITWRNQAATPAIAPAGRAAPQPAPAVTQRAAERTPVMTQRPAPPPVLTQRAAPPVPAARAQAAPPPQPLPPRASQVATPPQRFAVRRQPGEAAGAPSDFEIRREMAQQFGDEPPRVFARRRGGGHMMGGPERVIVQRGPIDGGYRDHGGYHEGDLDGAYHDDFPAYEDAYDDRYEMSHGEDVYADGHHDYGPAGWYAQGPCCSGGMITETITTTTTYPPTVEKHVSYRHVTEHKPARTYKRKMRGR